ncbi:MAG: hypothetical protein ABI835_02805 [Chloroflexota bacterium]
MHVHTLPDGGAIHLSRSPDARGWFWFYAVSANGLISRCRPLRRAGTFAETLAFLIAAFPVGRSFQN